jgi:outer membrane protein assembly factor BamB
MKRTFVHFTVALVVAAGGTAAHADAPVPTWTHAGYGAGNTGYNPAETVVNAASVGRLRPSWAVKPRPGTQGCSATQNPVITHDRMITVEADGLGAYDVATGTLSWRAAKIMPHLVGRTLATFGDLVLTTGSDCWEQDGPNTPIVALDVRTGKQVWKAPVPGIVHSVVADGGMLVAHSDCGVCEFSVVTGFRLRDGVRRWMNHDSLTGPVSARGRLLVAGPVEGSAGVDAMTGEELWRSDTFWRVRAADPSGKVFFAATEAKLLAAINAGTGKVLWRVPNADGELSTDGRRVYVSGATGLSAYDAATGHRLWHNAQASAGRPIRAGGLLYLPGMVLSPVTGVRLPVRGYGSKQHHVIVTGGRVYAVDGKTIRTYVRRGAFPADR